MDYKQNFRAAYIDFHEQGLGREVFLVTGTSDEEVMDMIKAFVIQVKGEDAWNFLFGYIGVTVVNKPDRLPLNIQTFSPPSKAYADWSPA